MPQELWMVAGVAALAGAVVGWLAGALSRSGAVHRASAERDHAAEERRRSDAALAAALHRVSEAERLRVAAEARHDEMQRRFEELRSFIDSTRQQLPAAYAQISEQALEGAINKLLHVVKPHLDGAKGDIVSTLDTKKVEIESLLTPLRQMLESYQGEVRQSEQQRQAAFGGLLEQIKHLQSASESAQKEAARLANALHSPQVRGSWGENTLRKCVEMAGMSPFCDFEWQYSLEGEEGRLRPDMIVRLPEERVIAVDSKSPIDAYLLAVEETDERTRKDLMAQHAANLKRHIDQLSKKQYQDYIERSLGKTLSFTIMFIPGEHFLSAAMITDSNLFEHAAGKNVVLASPTILVPLLRALASGWRAEQLEENAERATDLARELYHRFVKVFEYFEGVGRALDSAVSRFNEAARSVDSRLVPKARELETHIGKQREMVELKQIEKLTLQAARLTEVDLSEAPQERKQLKEGE